MVEPTMMLSSGPEVNRRRMAPTFHAIRATVDVAWCERNDACKTFIVVLTKRKSAYILSTSFFTQVHLEMR
jgi:hypothetical protein